MKQLWFLLLLVTLSGSSQNWNVFNKNYRYNYKFNNSPVISNVLFIQGINNVGSDTVYSLNTIGVINGNTLTANLPQLLMKKVIKQSNGNVKLQDTANILMIPTCSLNQTWLFDANFNYSATCVSTGTQTIFSFTDSVKVIVVNSADTVVLSKSFGIVQFPKLYGQNLYYRLVGIENRTSYDANALYGLKLANAWDFYDYYIGYQMCYQNSWNHGDPNIQNNQGCENATQVIKTKTITPNGYIYNIDKWYVKAPYSGGCSYSLAVTTFTNTDLYCYGLNGFSDENTYYPGMLVNTATGGVKLVKLGIDNAGRIYKYVGASCYSLTANMPNQNEPNGNFVNVASNTYTYQPNGMMYDKAWAVGLGKLNDNVDCLCYYRYCATCYGTVGTREEQMAKQALPLYPNPTNSKIYLPFDKGTILIYDNLGTMVKNSNFENRTVDLLDIPNGIYFIEIQTDSGKFSQKLIIQH